jgi:hypothetical protein
MAYYLAISTLIQMCCGIFANENVWSGGCQLMEQQFEFWLVWYLIVETPSFAPLYRRTAAFWQ